MKNYINVKGRLLDLSQPRIMGILNITPDSFYSASRVGSKHEIIKRTSRMIAEGAHIIDVGAYSSRPGADHISVEEEIRRLSFALEIIRKEFDDWLILSVDTFRSAVAREAVNNYEADIVNDISGGEADEEMFDFVGSSGVPYILMHMKGTPRNMQDNPEYNDVTSELLLWLSSRKSILVDKGVRDIIIDPGFGFGKSVDDNYRLLNELDRFKDLDLPLLAGFSRKSMIWKVLGNKPEEALNGTTVLNMCAVLKGASILRVHDVAPAVELLKLYCRIAGKEYADGFII